MAKIENIWEWQAGIMMPHVWAKAISAFQMQNTDNNIVYMIRYEILETLFDNVMLTGDKSRLLFSSDSVRNLVRVSQSSDFLCPIVIKSGWWFGTLILFSPSYWEWGVGFKPTSYIITFWPLLSIITIDH